MVPVALLVVALIAFLMMASSAGAVPTVTTDKAEYHPDETALISGTGYTSGQVLDIVVIRPDLSIVTGDGTNTPTPPFDFETADVSGAFTYSYILNGIFGLYTVNVYDKADTLHTTLLASTTFLDDAGPAACNGGPTDTSQPGSQYVIDGSSTPAVPTGEIVTGICIKAGTNSFGTDQHSGLITVDGTYGNNSCYTVSGIGTDTVTITRVFAGPTCKDISHIDFFTASAPTPTPVPPTDTPTPVPPTDTPTPVPPTDTPTPVPLTDTPTPVPPTDTPTPTPTPTPGKLPSTVVTDIHDDGHASVTNVPVDSIVHDEATVSGTGPIPAGTVDFTFYTNVDCSGAGVASGTGIALDVFGVAHPSDPQGPLAAGLYAFKAHYNGDANYLTGDSPCEPLDPVGPPVGGLVDIAVPGTGGDESGAGAALFGLILIAAAALFSAGATAAWVTKRR